MLRVVVDGGPLQDGRAEAGIGRYAACLVAGLAALPPGAGVEVSVARPRRRLRTERRPLRWLRSQPALVALALRRRARLVHVLGGEPSPVWPPSRQVVTVHDLLGVRPDLHPRSTAAAAYAGLTARLIRRCAAVIAVSRCVADEVVTELGLDPGIVHVVPEGVAPVFTSRVQPDDESRRRRLQVPTGSYVLWTGSLMAHDPRKALDVLVDAVATARRHLENELDLRLVLAGRDGPEARRVTASAARRGVPVVITGWIGDDDLASLQRGAAAAVVPSLHEGFGLPALEAMACGTPLVATRAGNLADLAGDAAVLCPPGDAGALATALTAVIERGSVLAPPMRALGPERAAPYTWGRTARLTAEVYAIAAGLMERARPASPQPTRHTWRP